MNAFVLQIGDPLSAAELMAARLDGDLADVGSAFTPMDTVETAALRAASLLPLLGTALAATHETAAWVHGARDQAPLRHSVQRTAATRNYHLAAPHTTYRDSRLPNHDVVRYGVVSVTSLPRTIADLLRLAVSEGRTHDSSAAALIHADPSLRTRTHAWFHAAGAVTFKRPALTMLARIPQEDVTR